MERKDRKRRLPFRLGCTSYVYPADLVANVRKTAPLFDDIEIVLFESEAVSNLPTKKTIDELGLIASEHGNTYTVHFPIDKKAASADGKERAFFQGQAVKIMNLTAPLEPFAYILHLEGVDRDAPRDARRGWMEGAVETCSRLLDSGLVDGTMLAVENLCYPPQWNDELVEMFGLSYCIDFGHLWLYGHDWRGFLKERLERTRVVHLHGVSGVADHLALCKGDRSAVAELVRILACRFRNVVTLEVFDRKAALTSARLVRSFCRYANKPCDKPAFIHARGI